MHVVNSEYSTPSQSINTGSFIGQYTITPSATANAASITDAIIKTELTAQIAAGHIPVPTLDAQGNPQTYYAVFFPPGKSINSGSGLSCSNFCAYHGVVAATGNVKEFFYGVHPDFQTGGCSTVCGAGTTFQNYCSVASHELVDMITGTILSII
jgi:hypothetical protein